MALAARSGAGRQRSTRCPSTSRRRSTYKKVVAYLKQELAALVLIEPSAPDELDPAGRLSPAPQPARSARAGSTSSSTSSPAARRSGRRAAAALPEQHLLDGDPGRALERRRGARAAAPPRGAHRARRRRPRRPARRAGRARARPRAASTPTTRRRRPGSASRSPGGCRTSDRLVPGQAAAPAAARPPRARSPCCSTRAGSRAIRRQTRLEANDVAILLRSRRARAHRRRRERLRDAKLFDVHVDPPRLRRRRLRRRAVAAEADGAARRRCRAPT